MLITAMLPAMSGCVLCCNLNIFKAKYSEKNIIGYSSK